MGVPRFTQIIKNIFSRAGWILKYCLKTNGKEQVFEESNQRSKN
ncbi:hypothetical protein SynPROSU1_02053 [Synechococcus sp. PROS-U-1]|nr:hypothetical protein SynPROSU1_02053 [Synechococcus sp. PROS-U-1]